MMTMCNVQEVAVVIHPIPSSSIQCFSIFQLIVAVLWPVALQFGSQAPLSSIPFPL